MVEQENSPREYIKCRSELSSPITDWEKSWQCSRLKGLGSEATSFLWKLLHCILPTEQRLARILPNLKEECKYCPDKTADLTHCFFECCKTRNVGMWLLSLVNQYDTIATASGILKLEFEVENSLEMPIAWLIAQSLSYIWGVRCSGEVVNLLKTRSVLESKINLLRKTRFTNESVLIFQIFENS